MGLLRQRGQTGVFRPVNRLDKDTSGLVLCARNAYAAPILAQSAQKVYRAVLQGQLPQAEGCIEAPIDRAPGSIILRCVSPQGKPSTTQYRQEKVCGPFSLVAAVPVTGRTHQLRVHFAHLGCPLAGDELYGGNRLEIGRHALHCARMQFAEPANGRTIVLESQLPADMARLVAEKLGVEAQFVEIAWDNKIMELDSQNIDVVWNGMTLTEEVTSAMECTNAYCNNAQVVVVPAE